MKRWIVVMLGMSVVLLASEQVGQGQDGAGPQKSLAAAAMDGDIEQIKVHLGKGTDVNKADSRGVPPLCHAAEWGHTEAVKVLLEGKANINARDANGRTPLLCAVTRGHADAVEVLVAAGADVNAKDSAATTALHVAAQWGHRDIVSRLVNAGADVNAQDNQRQTPLTIAERLGKTEIVDYLKQRGATAPVFDSRSPYGDAYAYAQSAPQVTGPSSYTTYQQPEVQLDPNAIREQLKQFPDLVVTLQAVDANSDNEQRGWIQRRYDNRTTLVRAVERQFEQEMVFIRTLATAEKAAKTIKAVDELCARRKERYDLISDGLRDQRREALQSRDTATSTRGRYSGRTRGRYPPTGQDTAGTYSTYASTPSSSAREEPNEPALHPDTANQMQAWLSANLGDKQNLLGAVYDLDLSEYRGLQQIAQEEEAKKTDAAIGGLMLARQQRVQGIETKWKEEDERQQRLQQRTQPGLQPGVPQDQQTGARRGRRYR